MRWERGFLKLYDELFMNHVIEFQIKESIITEILCRITGITMMNGVTSPGHHKLFSVLLQNSTNPCRICNKVQKHVLEDDSAVVKVRVSIWHLGQLL